GPQAGPGAGADAAADDRDLREGRGAEPDDGTPNALVADQDVTAAAEHAEGNVFLPAAADDGGQFLGGARLHEHLGGAAELEVGVGGRRLVALDEVGETLEGGHGFPPAGGSVWPPPHHRVTAGEASTRRQRPRFGLPPAPTAELAERA